MRPALAYAAWCLEQRLVRGWPPAGQDDAATAVALARRAIAAGSEDAMALVAPGFVLAMVARDYDTGLDAVRRALKLNPGSGFVAFLSGTALLFGGNPDDALVHQERAMALSPLDPELLHVSEHCRDCPSLQRPAGTRHWNWPGDRLPSIPIGTRPTGS